MDRTSEFYIGGAWVPPATLRTHALVDPSTEEVCATIALGDRQDTDAAVAAAKKAFPAWSVSDHGARVALVERILAVYTARAGEMAKAISTEMGAPVDMALASQVGAGRSHTVNFLEAFRQLNFNREFRQDTPGSRIALEPIGVVGLITPWNWPMSQVLRKVIPALLAGCTMVLKPSEESPLSALLFGEIMHEAGVPAGVFNLVNGDGAGVGTQLATHPDVEMISFTGSTRAGIAVSKAAAESLKRVCLELGGKGANLIFADADEKAVERGVKSCFDNSGQSCNSPTRMLVERSIYDRAVDMARATAETTRVASAHEAGAHIGPVVNGRQYERIQALIQKGIDDGARLVAGGTARPEGLNRGFFVRPTVFADVVPGTTIEREEIFGPVLSMIPFDTEEEAVRIANGTHYGLTNYVQTQDGARRNRLARQLRSGMVEMNGRPRGAGAPFGGVRGSGRAREGGVWGIEEFLEVKSISGWASPA